MKNQIVIVSRKIKDFLTNHIQQEYGVGNINNFRKVKKDVLTTLKKRLLIAFYWIRKNISVGFCNFWYKYTTE